MMARHRLAKLVVWALLIFVFLAAGYTQAASLAWNPSSGTVDGYKVYYGTSPSTQSKSVDVGETTRYDLNKLPLTENVTYYFSVSAYNSAGESSPCAPVVYTPGDTTPPLPPAGVSAD